MLPVAVFVPIVMWVVEHEAEQAGLIDRELGSPLMMGAMVLVFGLTVLLVAHILGRSDAERHEAEKARRRLADMVDSSHDAIIGKTLEGTITSWNEGAERIYGYSPEEVLGNSISLLIPSDRADEVDKIRARVEQDEKVQQFETRRIRRDGRIIDVAATISPIRDERGVVVGASSIDRDISELKRAHADRLEAEERFRRAFEDSGTGMALIAVEPQQAGRVLEVNSAFCELTGYPTEQLIRMDLETITHPDDLNDLTAGLQRLLADDSGNFHCEHRILTANGTVTWVALSASLVRDSSGDPAHRLVQLQDVSERKRFEGQLQYLADHDPLTGLYNRRRFEQELAEELTRAQRYGSPGVLLALDLDNFKYVNDSLGHAAGDELISSVGHALGHRLRKTDTVGRLGGDEFAVALPDATEEDALLVAKGILEVIRDNIMIEADHGPRRTTASIGIAPFPGPGEKVSAEELLVEADIAMYDAKENGRDRIAVYRNESDRQRNMEARLTWAERIRNALAEDRFVLHGQPIISLSDDEDGIERYELLLRMIGDDGDLIPPGTFLSVAERFGLIEEIDRWVVREAIRMLAAERRAGRRVCFSVNLSARSISEPEIVSFIGHHLDTAGADPEGLIFEVTETVAIENVDRAKQFARELSKLGCAFALDDFGSGFASFYYIKHLEFDYLKIDGEFIKNLPHDETDQLVVKSLVDIARGLGRKTVAEFVGDEATVTMLREYGVDLAQGFHLGRPEPLEGSSVEGSAAQAAATNGSGNGHFALAGSEAAYSAPESTQEASSSSDPSASPAT